MKEFDEFEIEKNGQDEEVRTGFCPLIKANCHGPLCMWWVRDFSEARNKLQAGCAMALIAVGINDESLHRIAGRDEDYTPNT